MRLYSNNQEINDKLNDSLFKKNKEKKLKRALLFLGNFGTEVEVFKLEDDKAYVKDNNGVIYEFTLDFFDYENDNKRKEFNLIKVREENMFFSYDCDSFSLKQQGCCYKDGSVVTEHISYGEHPRRYTLEKDDEKYSVSVFYQNDILYRLNNYCYNYQYSQNFSNFLEFCRGISLVYSGAVLMTFFNSSTNVKMKICSNEVEECNLKIDLGKEIVNLSYEDGKFVEDYKEIRKITEDELSDESKGTIRKIKRFIKD